MPPQVLVPSTLLSIKIKLVLYLSLHCEKNQKSLAHFLIERERENGKEKKRERERKWKINRKRNKEREKRMRKIEIETEIQIIYENKKREREICWERERSEIENANVLSRSLFWPLSASFYRSNPPRPTTKNHFRKKWHLQTVYLGILAAHNPPYHILHFSLSHNLNFLLSHSYLITSVTRFGEIYPIWQHFYIFG